jgi:hypothetical protein
MMSGTPHRLGLGWPPRSETDAVVARQVGGGLGRRDQIVDRQRQIGVRKMDFDHLRTECPKDLDRLAYGRFDLRLHPIDEVLRRDSQAQPAGLSVQVDGRNRLPKAGRVERIVAGHRLEQGRDFGRRSRQDPHTVEGRPEGDQPVT